jgi:hypothetical protein
MSTKTTKTELDDDWFLDIHCLASEPSVPDPVVFDEDGHLITACMNHEPVTPHILSVLIDRRTPSAEAVAILRKITAWVENGGLMDKENMQELEAWAMSSKECRP